jgi:hypothetical protein
LVLAGLPGAADRKDEPCVERLLRRRHERAYRGRERALLFRYAAPANRTCVKQFTLERFAHRGSRMRHAVR